MAYGFPQSDARSIDCVAMNILKGRGIVDMIQFFPYYSYRVPLYSIFLSMIYGFFGHSYIIAKIIQWILSSITAVIIYFIALKAHKDKKTATIAGITVAVYAQYIYYAHSLMTETLFIFFMSLSILLLLKGVQNKSLGKCAWAGVLSASATLVREAFFSAIPAIGLWILIILWRDKRKMTICCLSFATAIILTLSPLLIRNYYIHKKPILGSVGVRHLWNGADPKYMGSYFSEEAWRESLWINPYFTESQRMDYEVPKAFEYIKGYPYLFSNFCRMRFENFWKLHANPLGKLDLNKKCLPVILKIFKSLSNFVIPFGIFGFCISLLKWRQALLFGLIVSFYSAFHSIFGGTERFRLPIDWIFIIYASLFLCRLVFSSKYSFFDYETGNTSFFEEPAKVSRFQKRLFQSLYIVGAAIIAIYLCMVLPQYFMPEKEFIGYKIDTQKVESILKETGYYGQWLKQDKALYSVKDIIEKRLKESKPEDDYEPWLVAWTGEIYYLPKTWAEAPPYFSMYVNAHGRNIGDGRFRCYVKKNAVIENGNPKEGEIATIVGYTKGNALGAPRIQVLGIFPYAEQKE